MTTQCETPWCVKGEGHPGDTPGQWSFCHTDHLPFPMWAHRGQIGQVYAERDGSEHFIIVEHVHGESDDTEFLMLTPAETQALIDHLTTTLAAAGGL
jgi:hypothetical protein